MVERAAHNGLVVGSNPTKPKKFLIYNLNKMNTNFKKFKIQKFKKHLQNKEFLLFFQANKLSQKDWLKTEQIFKKIKVKYYKAFNSTTSNTFKRSIYSNYSVIVNNFFIALEPTFKTTVLKKNFINKEIKLLFILLSLKLNDKIYSSDQFKRLTDFSYNKFVFKAYKSFEKYSKITNIFNYKKKVLKSK